jgi:Putative zinc-finger
MNADHLSGKVACADVEESLAELALGILPGDERAIVLSHLSICKRCQAEAEKLTLTADTLLQLAPEVEPPVGFEVRLFERLGVSVPDAEVNVARRRILGPLARLSNRGRVWVAAAAVTLGVALGFGGGWVANPGTSLASPPSEHSVAGATATLLSDNHAVGTVSMFAGTPGWMLMTVHGGSASGWVTCEVTLANGRQVDVGSFRLEQGYGAWVARLPASAREIRSARVTTAVGALVGSATFAS